MKVITQNRFVKRLLLLFVLAGTLVYLRWPTEARADQKQQCEIECHNLYAQCDTMCLQAHAPKACYTMCTNNYNNCYASCQNLP